MSRVNPTPEAKAVRSRRSRLQDFGPLRTSTASKDSSEVESSRVHDLVTGEYLSVHLEASRRRRPSKETENGGGVLSKKGGEESC